MTTPFFLRGEQFHLRPLERQDADHFWQWCQDREASLYSLTRWRLAHSRDQIQEWLNHHIVDKTCFSLGIALRDGALIGEAGISKIDSINRSGEYYIFIGDRNHWGKGIGREVTRTIVDYGFSDLNLHRIMLTVSELNTAGIKTYRKAGFSDEGVMREACYRDGRYHHKLMMSILRGDWERRK